MAGNNRLNKVWKKVCTSAAVAEKKSVKMSTLILPVVK